MNSTPTRPNHRVEMNRHQLSCLPSRLDFMIASVHSEGRGQVAVTHSGRSGTPHDVMGGSSAASLVSFLGLGFGLGLGRRAASRLRRRFTAGADWASSVWWSEALCARRIRMSGMALGLSHCALGGGVPEPRGRGEPPPATVFARALGRMTITAEIDRFGQVAVTHPWRSGTVRRASGCSRWSVESELARRSRSRTVGLMR